jgi:hypothetical protein
MRWDNGRGMFEGLVKRDIVFWWGSSREGGLLEDLGVNGRRKTMYT